MEEGDRGGISTNTLSVKNEYFCVKTVHVVVIVKQYPRDFHVTIVPRTQSWYALNI